ncbi:MAG TPA: aromatic amino acid transport family protein [Lapillicoccus sp.]|nr:aromatic amino acid transport family protein [Lapillicoccus sp.]
MSRTPERENGPSLTRAELLGGLAGRRVSSALYVIESRTAYLALKARNAAAPVLSAGVLEEQERAFLSALAAGRDLPPPTIQELEQFAPQWAYLVPPDAVARAELAHRIGDKYRFRESDAGRIRAALGLDDPAVQQAYRERHRGELSDVYDTDLTLLERLRWTRARLNRRLEELPPFWTTYGLTLTETVGAGMLALPIAVAGVGPLPGVVIIVVLGLLNVLTVAGVAETFTRTGSVRWGGAFFGRVVRGYLGRVGGVTFGVGMTIYTAPVLLACYVGFGVTVAQTTHTSAPLWAAALFAVNIALVFRKRLDATIASALFVGFCNIVAIIILVALALTVLDADNVRYAAIPGSSSFDPSVVGVAFGVVLLCFYGHTSVGNAAQVVLKRDPGGRSLMRGSVAAMFTVIALYSLWVFAIGAAVPAARLRDEQGTALVPLAEEAGNAATVVGFVFVFLAVGMGTVHLSLGLYNLVAERFVHRRSLARLLGLALLGSIFVLAELLIITKTASFTGSMGVVGALTGPLMGGVFPVLMMESSRRRGDYEPALFWRWMGNPVVATFTFLAFMATEVIYIWLWPSAIQRLVAATVVVLVVIVTVVMLRSGALRPRAVIEVRRDEDSGRDHLHVVSRGRTVRHENLPPGERVVDVPLAPLDVPEVRAWAHQVDAGGESEVLAVTAALRGPDGDVPQEVREGSVVVQLDDGVAETLELRLPRVSGGARR